MMPEDEYDIAGFSIGFVDYDDIIDGKAIKPGDAIIGLQSSGFHSYGFSLVRKVFANELNSLGTHMPDLGCTLGEELLRPTAIYVKTILHLINQFGKDIKGVSNITGGGHYENLPRMLPEGIRARVDTTKIPQQPIFPMLAKKGSIPIRDMYNTFNMGVGVVLAVSAEKTDAVMSAVRLQGETPLLIGYCENGEKGVDIM